MAIENCEIGECENDPEYTEPYVVPPLPTDEEEGGGGGGDGDASYKLPASMVYDFVSPVGDNNPSTADNAKITARVVNTTTGASSSSTLMMPMASPTKAGSMAAADKAKLDNLLSITSISDSLELDENGQLNVVGGGSDVNLLSKYTASPTETDAYNAAYVNGRLDSAGVALGSQAYIDPDGTNKPLVGGVAIGINAKGRSPSGTAVGTEATATRTSSAAYGYQAKANANYSLAIGAVATATHQESIALGFYTSTTRANELSIKSISGTRYIGGVKAGTQPTDAVNLQQMQDYVAENAGISTEDKAKLDSLVDIKSLGDSLQLDENGQLSIVQTLLDRITTLETEVAALKAQTS